MVTHPRGFRGYVFLWLSSEMDPIVYEYVSVLAMSEFSYIYPLLEMELQCDAEHSASLFNSHQAINRLVLGLGKVAGHFETIFKSRIINMADCSCWMPKYRFLQRARCGLCIYPVKHVTIRLPVESVGR